MPLSADGLDELLVQIEFCAAKLECAMANIVKKSKAEFELARRFDDASNFMDRLLVQQGGREQLRLIFASDGCRRLAHLSSLCKNTVLSGGHDLRRQTCLRNLAKVESIIMDLGFVEEIQAAKQVEEAILKRASEDVDMADTGAIKHLADASMAGSEAISAELEGNYARAVDRYQEAQSSLASMIALGRAVSKLKGLVGKGEAVVADDVDRLVQYREQIVQRMESLAHLPAGEQPRPVEEELDPPSLDLLSNPRKWKMVIAHCARQAVDTGSSLLGPWGGMLAQGMRRAFQTAIHYGGRAVQCGGRLAGVGIHYGGHALQNGPVIGKQALQFLQARAKDGVANVAVSITRQAATMMRRDQQRARSYASRRSIETIAETVTITLGPGAGAARGSRGQDSETLQATAMPDAAQAPQALARDGHGELPREQSFATAFSTLEEMLVVEQSSGQPVDRPSRLRTVSSFEQLSDAAQHILAEQAREEPLASLSRPRAMTSIDQRSDVRIFAAVQPTSTASVSAKTSA